MHARPQVERIVSNAMTMSSASGLDACTVRAVRSGFFSLGDGVWPVCHGRRCARHTHDRRSAVPWSVIGRRETSSDDISRVYETVKRLWDSVGARAAVEPETTDSRRARARRSAHVASARPARRATPVARCARLGPTICERGTRDMGNTLTLDVLAPCARATSVAAPPSSLGIWRTCGAIARHGRMGFVGVFFSPGSGPTVTDEPRKQTFAHLEDAAGGRAPARVAREVGLMIPVEGRAVVEVRVEAARAPQWHLVV